MNRFKRLYVCKQNLLNVLSTTETKGSSWHCSQHVPHCATFYSQWMLMTFWKEILHSNAAAEFYGMKIGKCARSLPESEDKSSWMWCHVVQGTVPKLSKDYIASIFRVLACLSLKLKALQSFETGRHIPEELHLQQHYWENLKCHKHANSDSLNMYWHILTQSNDKNAQKDKKYF